MYTMGLRQQVTRFIGTKPMDIDFYCGGVRNIRQNYMRQCFKNGEYTNIRIIPIATRPMRQET